jgi:hypothetical protein
MFVRLVLTDITANQTSDSQDPITGAFDHTDEDYFLVAGASVSDGPISYRVTPPQDDHYDISDGQTLHNFMLWEGFVGPNAGAFLTVAIRDRKNAFWGTVLNVAETAGLAAGAIFLEDPNLGQAALKKLEDPADTFIHDLHGDNDKTLGSFSVRLTTDDGVHIQMNWEAREFTNLLDAPANPNVHFSLTGANCQYQIAVGVEILSQPMIVSVNSGKCLDVPGLALDDVQIQQFAINGGLNQRWYLKLLGVWPLLRVVTQPNVNLGFGGLFFAVPYYAILASHSGKALDVRGGSTADYAAIQQFHPHYGPDQQFAFVNMPGADGFLIVNVYSGKCFDVADASLADQAVIQQLTVNGQANERWQLQA